jgi:dihydrofolate reductase
LFGRNAPDGKWPVLVGLYKTLLMRKISVFNFLTLNGFYKGVNDDISWHRHGGDENAYAEEGAQSESILLFGRKTYEMMAGYWPSPMALEQNRKVADGMNRSEKIVFSTTLQKADWENTRIISRNGIEEVAAMKNSPGKDMTILGSGSLVTQLTDAGLIDEYQFMIDPVALGTGTPVFQQINTKLDLELISCRTFSSGVVLLLYKKGR